MFTCNTQGSRNLLARGRAPALVGLLLAAYRRHRAGRTSAQAFARETAAPLRELRKLSRETPVVEDLPTVTIVRRIVHADGTVSSPFVLRPAPTPENPYAQEWVPWEEEPAATKDAGPGLAVDELTLLERDLTARAVRGSVTKEGARAEGLVLDGLRVGLLLTAPLEGRERLTIRHPRPAQGKPVEARP